MTPTPVVPELMGIPVATLALIVAGASFIVALVALGWQIAKHFLDGGRAKVYLNSAIWMPELSLYTYRTGRWQFGVAEETYIARENFEVAQIVVENPSRTPMTVHTPSLDIRGIGQTKRSISPRMFALEDFGAENSKTDSVVRIDPYDRVTFVADYWSIVPGLLAQAGPKGVSIRAMVSIAGRRKPQRSSWRRRWRIPQGAWTARTDLQAIAPYTVLWRELFRSVPAQQDESAAGRQVTQGMVSFLLDQALHRFSERPPREELDAAIDDVALSTFEIKYPVIGIGLWNGYEALDRLAGHLGPWRWRPASPGSPLPDTATS